MSNKPPMDRIDCKILAALLTDGRVSNQRLSEEVARSPSACLAQVSGAYDFLVRFLVPDMESWTTLADELADGELTIETVRTVASMRRIKGWVGVPIGDATEREANR